ncbi:hypothetical protein L2E82_41061 [Cichorium intybus]|uniref:Uncharacterized protein n=1 Tax=Cichorium intybus TaxID=13427 RepID=A0ACB9ARV6_CICIN|nr:hypothetical protein L2E82_41061 [Cichorium intybus]
MKNRSPERSNPRRYRRRLRSRMSAVVGVFMRSTKSKRKGQLVGPISDCRVAGDAVADGGRRGGSRRSLWFTMTFRKRVTGPKGSNNDDLLL